ncbi:RNA polymerase sigma factor [Siphonobacter aquaeclarae]|uniref:RNA polymerase sigma-70 factor, ECF subfamily n=1 Tax=Siphonobacter aquaeclarae TaxID=563176 RepID=A0A1G9IGU0_9BACT|nr:RNA polymerase sigma-70 factor [Siphonobacter aquaeclarae]SDL24266.1 RNA polymerase sigma-70 factor, ECF subfamily [Siphonobacter aquaeclarae]
MNPPSQQLLNDITQGNESAFALLYNRYRPSALRYCLAIVKEPEEAENIFHEVLIKLWERRTFINPELNFHAYLFTCLRNTCFDFLKEMERDAFVRQQYAERQYACGDEDYEEHEQRLVRLRQAIHTLPRRRKRILLLTIEQDHSYQEIAELLHISRNTVKNHLVKARHVLREQLIPRR